MGEVLALLTAFLWAIGVVLFKKSVGFVSPFSLNLFKNCVGLILLAGTAVLLGQVQTGIPMKDFVVMLVSGALGIGVSDTLLFMALKRLGASRTALIDCLYSPFVIIFSLLILKEQLPALAAVGGILILGSVVLSSQENFGEVISPRQFKLGCLFGSLAMATVALAIVIVKPLLNTYPLSWLSTIRMAGGIAVLVVLLPMHPDRRSVYSVFRPQRAWRWMLSGTFMGTYLSLMAWLAGFKYSQAGVVALLNQTSTVLIVLLASLVLKEPMTKFKLISVAVAFLGVVIIVW
jgi:drug/metabolite transporter (DMT)-like permease